MKCYPSGALLGLLVFYGRQQEEEKKKHVIYSSFIELHPG